MFLLEDASDVKFAGLLTDGSMSNVFGDEVSSKPMFHETQVSNPFEKPATPVVSPVRENVAPASRPSSVNRPVSRSSMPPPPPSATRPVVAVTRPPPEMPGKFKVSILKSEHGIGLDISKNQATGGTSITRLKAMPDGVPNPAAKCTPQLLPGDAIVAVNGTECPTFSSCVKLIRASEGTVALTIERK